MCSFCGARLSAGLSACPHCDAPLPIQAPSRPSGIFGPEAWDASTRRRQAPARLSGSNARWVGHLQGVALLVLAIAIAGLSAYAAFSVGPRSPGIQPARQLPPSPR